MPCRACGRLMQPLLVALLSLALAIGAGGMRDRFPRFSERQRRTHRALTAHELAEDKRGSAQGFAPLRSLAAFLSVSPPALGYAGGSVPASVQQTQSWRGGSIPFETKAQRSSRLHTNMMTSDAVAPLAAPAHETFLADMAGMTMDPKVLSLLSGILVSQGEELVTPGVNRSLHPLLVPLTASASTGQVTGFLRSPFANSGDKLPIVRTSASGRQLFLLADCAEHFIKRAVVMADSRGDADTANMIELAKDAIGFSYTSGDGNESVMGHLGYLVLQVGPFSEVYQELAMNHVNKGAEGETAALVTCDRMKDLFSDWGHPCAYEARIYRGYDRLLEERGVANDALKKRLWTLGDEEVNLEQLCGASAASAGPESLAKLVEQLRDQASGKWTGDPARGEEGDVDPRSSKEIAQNRTSYLMDLVVAEPEKFSWASIREEMTKLYTQADMPTLAKFVNFPAPLI